MDDEAWLEAFVNASIISTVILYQVAEGSVCLMMGYVLMVDVKVA